jgi:predicted neutral ceramidase superfamily lipid hydrolase
MLHRQQAALAMLECIIFSLLVMLVGIVLGQRFRVLILVPGVAVLLPIAIGVATFSHEGLGTTLLLAVLTVGTLQIGYLLGVGFRYALVAARIGGLRSRGGPQPARRPSAY